MTETAKPNRQRRFARMPATSPAPEGQTAAPLPGIQPPSASSKSVLPKAPTKVSQIVALLQRPEGATLDEMIAATNWLPHTTRAALTGLRKKGHNIEKTKRDEVTCYRIVVAA